LKKIPEPAVKKIKMSPKKKSNTLEEEQSSSQEAETPSAESMNDIVYDLMKRVDKLETKPNTDRDFLRHLMTRDDLPKKIRKEIIAHTNK